MYTSQLTDKYYTFAVYVSLKKFEGYFADFFCVLNYTEKNTA